MSKIYVVNSDMKNVIGMSDPNVMFRGPGSLIYNLSFALIEACSDPISQKKEFTLKL